MSLFGITIGATIFVLGLLIFIHELGHFLVAKRSGIRVERFSLGFGPRIVGKKVGETEYRLSWIPFGGYVKMAGDEPDETEIRGEPWEFMSKPVRTRALVITAGPVMNFFLALLIFWGQFYFRGVPEVHWQTTVVGLVDEQGPAYQAGIRQGDQIIAVNGVEVKTFLDLARIIHQQVEKPVEVKWLHNGEEYSASITTMRDRELTEKGEKEDIGKIGIGPSYSITKVGFSEAFAEAVGEVGFILVGLLKFLGGFFTGASSLKQVGGPILIAQMAGEAAKSGFGSLLYLTAILSVTLFLVNVLPIPVLDGGHLLFLTIEKIKGSPLSLKQRMTMQQIGLAFLILLMVLVTYNDFLREVK